MLTEGIVLSSIGGLSGLALGIAGMRGLIAMSSRQLPSATEASLQPAVLLFALVLVVVTGLVFGLVPAVAVIRGGASSFLKEDSRSGSAGRGTARLRSVLVVAEVALALMLLVAAGLLIKSFTSCSASIPVSRWTTCSLVRIVLPPARYSDAAARAGFWTRLVERARVLPGVTAAGLVWSVPFSGNVEFSSYSIVGYTPGAGEPATTRAAGCGWRRLLPRDADSAHRRPRVHRRGHGRKCARHCRR